MPRRRRHGVAARPRQPCRGGGLFAALVALATAAGSAACQADLGTAGCQITKQTTLPGTPLTLLAEARLDIIGSGYALIGYDPGSNAVRWALGADGNLGTEHAFGLPPGVTSPMFAMAGTPTGTPADTVLIAYVGTDPTATKGELAMIAVPADGSPPQAPAATIHEFPKGIPPASSIAMASSRKGGHAGLAWIDDAMGRVMYAAIDATGQMVVSPTPTASAAPDFSCLGFAGGKDDVTVVYYAAMANQGKAGWIIAEGNEAGGIDSSVSLTFERQMGSCATVTATAAGYGIAWQDSAGSWASIYTTADNKLTKEVLFAPANDFSGANLQPPIVALAPFGRDLGVLFQRAHDPELWRLEQTGDRRSGALIFPSAEGYLGTVSASRVGSGATEALTATYADYTGSGDGTAGSRLFVNATCY
ncbi:MAG TPA: hypothetical protein VHO67_14925 [Polyangia bacterium]|nr:hypothetical protein [Polyangia bacterium]